MQASGKALACTRNDVAILGIEEGRIWSVFRHRADGAADLERAREGVGQPGDHLGRVAVMARASRRNRAYMRHLRVIAPGDAFILGIADNAMPDSVITGWPGSPSSSPSGGVPLQADAPDRLHEPYPPRRGQYGFLTGHMMPQ